MRHSIFGRQLSRNKNERRRLLQGLARDLVRHSSVRTTLAKAKAVQPLIEKLVTSAKKSSGAGSRSYRGNPSGQKVAKVLSDKESQKLILADAPTRFSKRQSGFTRIVKLGPRMGDNAEEVLLQFVDERVTVEVVKAPPVPDSTPKLSKLPKLPKLSRKSSNPTGKRRTKSV
jgi:large subunit ribosomal protein L17